MHPDGAQSRRVPDRTQTAGGGNDIVLAQQFIQFHQHAGLVERRGFRSLQLRQTRKLGLPRALCVLYLIAPVGVPAARLQSGVQRLHACTRIGDNRFGIQLERVHAAGVDGNKACIGCKAILGIGNKIIEFGATARIRSACLVITLADSVPQIPAQRDTSRFRS